jgi:hypothetical protein
MAHLTVDKADPLYETHFNLLYAVHAEVYLDGVKQKHCVTADDEHCYIVRYLFNDNGRPVIDGGKHKREIVGGDVKIVIPQDKVR